MAIGGAVDGSNWQHGTHGALSSLTDFTDHMISVEMKSAGEKIPADTWNIGFHKYENGFKDVTITAVYEYTDTLAGQLWDIHLNDDVVDWQLGPNGITTGLLKFTGTAQIDSITDGIVAGQRMTINVEMSMAGSVTKGAFA
jgi:hypothetical protein